MTPRFGRPARLTRLRGLRVGVVANPASVDQDFTHIVDRVAKTDGVTLGAIFGPQHGFTADLQDNMIETPHAEDRGRHVPIYSLYSETREPTGRDAGGTRRARHRPAGRRRAHLHLRLHDGQLPARRRAAWGEGLRLRPPESHRRHRGGGRAPSQRVRVVRRAVPDPDAARDDHRRAGAVVQRALRHRRRRSRWWRWKAGGAGSTGTRRACRG